MQTMYQNANKENLLPMLVNIQKKLSQGVRSTKGLETKQFSIQRSVF